MKSMNVGQWLQAGWGGTRNIRSRSRRREKASAPALLLGIGSHAGAYVTISVIIRYGIKSCTERVTLPKLRR